MSLFKIRQVGDVSQILAKRRLVVFWYQSDIFTLTGWRAYTDTSRTKDQGRSEGRKEGRKEGKGREGKGREGKGREGKERKGKERKGRKDGSEILTLPINTGTLKKTGRHIERVR